MKNGKFLFLSGVLIISFLFAVMIFLPGLYRPMERRLGDLRETLKVDFERSIDDIVIVDVDEKSLKELGRFQNWPRYYFARALEKVSSTKPEAIGMDIIFSERDSLSGALKDIWRKRIYTEMREKIPDEDSTLLSSIADSSLKVLTFDRQLINSVKIAEDIILAAYMERMGGISSVNYGEYSIKTSVPDCGPGFEGITGPFDSLLEVSDGIGIINTISDIDGVVRKVPLIFRHRGNTYPSFPLAVASMSGGFSSFKEGSIFIGGRRINLEDGCRLRINYQGDYGTFHYESFVDVLRDTLKRETFRDKIVLFGASAPGLGDYSQAPFGAKLPNVECHANVIHNLLFSQPITSKPLWVIITVSSILIFILLYAANRLHPVISSFLVLIFIGGYFLFAIYQYRVNLVACELARPLMGMMLAFVSGLGLKISSTEKEKKKIKSLFSKYVPEEVVNQLLALETFSLEGKRQEISVLFCDIRDFTPRAERESPERIVKILNNYFEEMSGIIFEYSGMIDKYLGDGIMAMFGAPLYHPGHADRAVCCAIEMQRRIRELNHREILKGKEPLKIGIGISSGVCILGNVGSQVRADYTAVGDVVNIAARLEPMNKEYGTGILISEGTYKMLEGEYSLQFLGKERLKGKSDLINIYTVSISKEV